MLGWLILLFLTVMQLRASRESRKLDHKVKELLDRVEALVEELEERELRATNLS